MKKIKNQEQKYEMLSEHTTKYLIPQVVACLLLILQKTASSVIITANVKELCAVGDFGNGTFDLPQKPDRSTDVQLTTSAPIAQNTCYGLPF